MIVMNRITQRAVYAMLTVMVTMAVVELGARTHALAQSGAASASPAAATPDPVLVSRGAYLAKLGDCAGCHTLPRRGAPFSGGLAMRSPFGTIYSTNITPDPRTGIGRYSYADFERALRDGVAPGGKPLYPAMPYPSFTKISDEDMRALYAYFMHGVQPVSNRPPETKLPFPFSQRWAMVLWDFAFVRHGRFTPDDEHDAQWNRGAYIVQSLGHCGACHTPRGPGFEERGYDESSKLYLTGGVNDDWFAPNLTGAPGSGLGRVPPHDIALFLKSGHGADVHIVPFGSMVQVVEDSTQYFNDDDLNAIAHYLKSLPARESSGAYRPRSLAAQQSAVALKTGDVERPGAGLYMSFCAKCHRADGRGEPKKFPALAGNPTVLASDTSSLIRLVIQGGSSPQTMNGPQHRKMPAFADQFTDTEIASVLTFVRNTWGNDAEPVTTRDVSAMRGKLRK
jgi:mono/diheme cytochrome c family protein